LATLRDLGEFGLIARFTGGLAVPDSVVVGAGDDCAVLRVGERLLLVSCDASIEGVHFDRSFASPEDIGWKAAASALSDIAAMGGHARFVLVTLACPAETPVETLDALYRGLTSAVAEAEAAIVGGDTTQSPAGIVLDVTVMGEAEGGRYLLRRGAKPGDLVAVTGTPGKSAAGLVALQSQIHAPSLARAHLHPIPRLREGRWLAERAEVHAMIDLSDGLLQDVGHIAEASACGVDIDPALLPAIEGVEELETALRLAPETFALAGGEDYELAITFEAGAEENLLTAFRKEYNLPLTVVGRVTDAWQGVRIAGETSGVGGYDHFRR
jgi:thiamine-monophosphate kinase